MNKFLKILLAIVISVIMFIPFNDVSASGKTITCEYVITNKTPKNSTYNVALITFTYNGDTQNLNMSVISLLSHQYKSTTHSLTASNFSSYTCPENVYVTPLTAFDKTEAYLHLPTIDLTVSLSSDGATLSELNRDPIISNNSSNSGTSTSEEQMNCSGTIIDIPIKAANLLNTLYIFIKIATPVVLIFMGMLDFGKAMVSNNENDIKANQSKFVKRLIAAGMVFLTFVLIELALNLFAGTDAEATKNCINLIIKS